VGEVESTAGQRVTSPHLLSLAAWASFKEARATALREPPAEQPQQSSMSVQSAASLHSLVGAVDASGSTGVAMASSSLRSTGAGRTAKPSPIDASPGEAS